MKIAIYVVAQNVFHKPVAVLFLATTKTVTSTLTGLLSTKTTCREPSVSVTRIVEPDPLVDSNETMAVDSEINPSVTQL